MALNPQTLIGRMVVFAKTSHLIKFLIVGVLSFAIDLGLLVLLHEVFLVDLWIATPIAFLVSLVFNFFLQRSFTFSATNKSYVSLIKYILLVIFNILATDVIVNLFDGHQFTYAGGKVVATISTMTWNFFLYKYWIFPTKKQSSVNATRSELQ